MADIAKVFNFKNTYQTTNMFNKLALDADQLSTFFQIIAEGYDIEDTRKQLLEYVSKEDYETYMYLRELLREGQTAPTVGLNDIIELKGLIEEVSKKMNDEVHQKLVELITSKASANISNLFFTYVKDYETNKDVNIDIEQMVDGLNFASSIFAIKNDIKQIIDSAKKEQPTVSESFKIPAKYNEINKANGKSLEALKESYVVNFSKSNDEYYQEMLYEANVKLNTAKLTPQKLIENINNHRRTTLWVNNIGRMIFNPISENKWNIIHYSNTLRDITTKRLVEFVNALDFNLLNEKKEEKLYDDSIDTFNMEIQDVVDKDQEHRGIKPIKEDEENDHEVEDWDFYYKGKKIGSSKIDRDLKTGIGKTVSFKDENDNDIEYDDDSRYAQCVWCGDHLPKNEMRKERKMGWLCNHCARGLESREGKLDFDDDVEECTCAGNIASVPQNIFSKSTKKVKKESKDLQFAKEAAEMLDEYCFSINGRHISYKNTDDFTVLVDGKLSIASNKENYFKLLEMIDNNEDISDFLLDGLTIDDYNFLNEDYEAGKDDPNEQPMPADGDANPEEESEKTADTDQDYQDKKEKLQQMADSGVSNISVKQVDNTGQEISSDNYEVMGIEDNDDTGVASSAIIKDKNTGEMKTVDPHIIDIKG